MALALTDKTLVEAISRKEGSLNLAKQAALVVAGIAALAISAKSPSQCGQCQSPWGHSQF